MTKRESQTKQPLWKKIKYATDVWKTHHSYVQLTTIAAMVQHNANRLVYCPCFKLFQCGHC